MKNLNKYLLILFCLVFGSFTSVVNVHASNPAPQPQFIPLTGPTMINLEKNASYQLLMRGGNEINIPVLSQSNLKVVIEKESAKGLPASLPEDVWFIDAVSINFLRSGMSLDNPEISDLFSLYFAQDTYAMETERTFVTLYWNGNEWEEVMANRLDFQADKSGLYVLVER